MGTFLFSFLQAYRGSDGLSFNLFLPVWKDVASFAGVSSFKYWNACEYCRSFGLTVIPYLISRSLLEDRAESSPVVRLIGPCIFYFYYAHVFVFINQ